MPGEEAMHSAYAHRPTALVQSRLELGPGDIYLISEQLLSEVLVRLDPAPVPIIVTRLPTALPC